MCPKLLFCGNKLFSCGNGMDDDGDGLIDTDDPDCPTPCDDDESIFATGIPGGNPSCTRDCYFDGNTGVADEKCEHRLTCDPLGPGSSCPPDPNAAQCATDPELGPDCLDMCVPRVPNGCDCWGCCELPGANGWVYLDHWECSSDAPEKCPPCTPLMDACGNPCEHAACEICIGEDAPPQGCAAPSCADGTPCSSRCDCGDAQYCVTGCCRDVPE